MTTLGQEPITRRRYAAGSRGSDGRWTRGAVTDTDLFATVQPANARDLQILPEGLRQRDAIKLYTDDAVLRTANQNGQGDADEVVVDGVSYEVQSIARQRAVMAHYKALATRIQESA